MITDNYFQDPYLNEWNSLYPGTPFPTPETQPQMYPEGSYTEFKTNHVIFSDCEDWRTCPKGPIDYACQWKHFCVLPLIEFGIAVVVTVAAVSVLIVVFSKATSLAYSLLTSLLFLHKLADILTSCLKCLSFGLLSEGSQNVDANIKEDKLGAKQEKIAKRMKEYDVELNFEALDKFQIRKVENILEDYEIVSNSERGSTNSEK